MNNITTFEDNVKLKLKGIVAELIPEEQWDKIAIDTINEFKRVDLPKLIKTLLHEEYKILITKELNSERFRSTWDGTAHASDAVKKLIEESAPQILSAIIGGSIQTVVEQLRYQIQARTY